MLENLIDNCLINSGDRVAVGVSGGADSMVLLCALKEKQKTLDFYLKAINVNHHLRGEESDRDSEFVKNFCEKNKIDYAILNVDVKAYKDENKQTIEESARNLRYQAIFNEMKNSKINKLFLAHHKDDQAETILMHIFRGSGVSGAVGIFDSELVKHPFLNLSKSDILKIAKENDITYVEDSTNQDNLYSRNFIRNVVLPEIEKKYPSAKQNLFNFGKRCKEMQEFVKSMVDENKIKGGKKRVELDLDVLNQNSVLVQEYIKRCFNKLGIFYDIESKHYELVSKLNNLQTGSVLNLPHKVTVKRSYDKIIFAKESDKTDNGFKIPFTFGETYFENFGRVKIEIVKDSPVFERGSFFADYDKLKGSIWRTKEANDTFKKFGGGTKPLSRYFIDKKIENDERAKIPILTLNNKVLVVFGFDISDEIKVNQNTKTIVKFEFEKQSVDNFS